MLKKLVSVVTLALLLLLVAGNSLAESMVPFAVVQCNVSATIIIADGKAQAVGTVAHVPSGYSVKTSVVLQKNLVARGSKYQVVQAFEKPAPQLLL